MTLWRIGSAAAIIIALASCAPRERPAPAPEPPRPAPQPPATRPPVAQPAVHWIDAPLAPGDWSRDGAVARYGTAGVPSFTVRCEAPGRVVLARSGAGAPGTMIVRTSSASRSLPARAGAGGAEATLAASDPLLDAMLYSRGRFSIEVAGRERLVVPAWPEPARVVEDCRG